MTSFEQIIDDIGGASGLSRALGIPDSHARTMKARKSVPVEYWPALIEAAERAGIAGISHAVLVTMASEKAKRSRAAA